MKTIALVDCGLKSRCFLFAFVKSVHNIKPRKERFVKLIPKATHITWTTMECSGSCKRWRRSTKTNKRRVMKSQMTQLTRGRRANIVPLSHLLAQPLSPAVLVLSDVLNTQCSKSAAERRVYSCERLWVEVTLHPASAFSNDRQLRVKTEFEILIRLLLLRVL